VAPGVAVLAHGRLDARALVHRVPERKAAHAVASADPRLPVRLNVVPLGFLSRLRLRFGTSLIREGRFGTLLGQASFRAH
jgi:hypothetical protein